MALSRNTMVVLSILTATLLFVTLHTDAQEGGLTEAPTDYVFSLPRETGAIGTSFLEMTQKYNTVGADGDLRISIPLFQVPGKIPVPLDLTYKSGIQLDQSASWVGLGWNLGGWSIKRVTVHGDDLHSFTYYDRDNQSRFFVNDVYQVDIPGRSLRFFNKGTLEEPDFVPMQHSLDSLYVDVDPVRHMVCDSSCEVDTIWGQFGPLHIDICQTQSPWNPVFDLHWSPEWQYSRYNYFVLFDDNATRYVFKLPLKKSTTGGPVEDFYRSPGGQIFGGSCNVAYDSSAFDNSEWMLTAILSHDYVDGGGDPLDPLDSPKPNIDNGGSWVSFVYTGYEHISGEDADYTEYTKQKRLLGRWVNSENQSEQTGKDWTEIAYLRKIVTPEVVVDFTVRSLDLQYRNVRWWRSGIGQTGIYRTKDLVLSKLRVFEYSGDSTLPVGVYPDPYYAWPEWMHPRFDARSQELFAATFNYEYEDSTMLKTQWHRYFYGDGFACDNADANRHGEATLHSVVIGTDNRLANFDDGVGQAREYNAEGYKKRYAFTYDVVLEDPLGPLSVDCSSGDAAFHRFSNYSSWILGQDLPIPYGVLSNLMPWSNDDLEQQGWVESTAHLIPEAWTFRDFFGYHYQHPQAWSLTKMTIPEGLTFQYDYESDEFKINGNHWNSGGCRVKNIIVNAPADTTLVMDFNTMQQVPDHSWYPWRDLARTDTIAFTYGDNDDGIGYATSMPSNYEIFREEYSGASMNWEHYEWLGKYLRFLGDNADHTIQYPKVTWHLPQDNGTIEQYYLTTKTVPSHRRVTMRFLSQRDLYVEDILQRSAFDWYDAFWLDRSPLHGVNYKTVMMDAVGNEVYYDEKLYSWPIVEVSLFPQIDGFETSRFTFTSDRFDCDTIAICYDLRLDQNIVRKDGVETVTDYTYESGPLHRLAATSLTVHGKERITEYEYAATGIPEQPTPFDSQHYLSLKTKVTTREVPGEKREERIFTYKSDFSSQSRSGEQAIWYLHETKDWLDYVPAPDNYLVTEVLDVDRLGDPIAIRLPDSTENGAVYSGRGLEASFVNVSGDNWAYFSEDQTVPVYTPPGDPSKLHVHSPSVIAGPEAPSFTGQHSCMIPAATSAEIEGIGAFWVSPQAGTYIAECWAMSSGTAGAARLYMAGPGETVTTPVSTSNEWQHLVCSLLVSPGDYLSVGTSATVANAYFDDFRVYPAGCLAVSYTFDPMQRKTTASGPDNIPSRAYYNQYGDLACVADYQYNPVEGREWFFKSTEPLERYEDDALMGRGPGLKYRADMPNAVYTITGRGRGIIDDFSSSRLFKYVVDSELIAENGRLWFEAVDDDTSSRHGDLKVPVERFRDGIMFFDELDSVALCPPGDTCNSYPSGYTPDSSIFDSHLWFGIETDDGKGYAACFTRSDYFLIFKYESPDYGNWTILSSHNLWFPSLWQPCNSAIMADQASEYCVPDRGKQRLGLARIGSDLYFFVNNDCIYRLTDTSFDGDQFSYLRFRFRRGTGALKSLRIGFDNLTFFSDPSITTDFINASGLTKQTQVFDGSRITVTGATNTLDFRSQCVFKPIPVDQSTSDFGCLSSIGYDINPFDFISPYLVGRTMYEWEPGESLDSQSFIAQYFADSIDIDDLQDGELNVPYSRMAYDNDPFRRPSISYPPGIFRNHPTVNSYSSTDTPIAGFPSSNYAADSVFDELSVDENGNVTHIFKDKLDRVISSSRPSQDWSRFECAGQPKDTAVIDTACGSVPGYRSGVYYCRKTVIIPGHLVPSVQTASAISHFHPDASCPAEKCQEDMYTQVYRNDTLVASATGVGGFCELGSETKTNNVEIKPRDIITLIAVYPEEFCAWGETELTFEFTVCDDLGLMDTTSIYTSFYKDFFGNDTLIVQPEGHQIRRWYNNQGWLLRDSSGDFGLAGHLYDKRGNLRLTLDASGAASVPSRFHYAKYDAHDRPIEEGYILGCITSFNQVNAFNPDFPDPILVDTASYRVTARYDYDQGEFGRGRLTKAVSYASGHPDSVSWEEYVYDAFGRVTQKKQHVNLIDASTSTRDIHLQYNNLGQTTRITYPNGGYVNYTYDQAGRVSKVEDSLQIFQATFDYWPNGQVKTKALGVLPAQTIDYKYNARDWLVSINNGQAIDSVTGTGDHFGLALNYSSGAYVGPQSQYPGGYYNGNVASYVGRVSDNMIEGGVRATEQSFAYDPLDRLTGESFGGTGTVPEARLYGFDRNSNLSQVRRASDGALVLQYNYYPGTNRLECTGSSGNCSSSNFLYTPSGSMTRYVREDMDLGYNYQEELSRRVMSGEVARDTVRYWYNTSGQRISKRYKYKIADVCWQPCDTIAPDFVVGGLESLSLPPGDSSGDTTLAPLYLDSLADTAWVPLSGDSSGIGTGGMELLSGGGGDPCGSWVSCPRVHTNLTGYYYLGDDLLFDYGTTGGAPTLIGNYVYVNGERVGKFENDSYQNVDYYLTDHLGSVMVQVDYSGAVKVRNLYRPWGEKLNSAVTGGRENQFQYTGQYLDEDLSRDLAYYGQRYYDPGLKIFTSPDPQSDKDPGTGPYVYCRNNPVKYVDPEGEVVETIADVASVGMSAYDMYKNPSWSNAGWLALDIVCAAVPFIPAVGIVRHGGKVAEVVDAGKKLLGVGEGAVDAAKAADNAASAAVAAKGANNPTVAAAIEKGKQFHADFAKKVEGKPGWQSQPTLKDPMTGKPVRPDALSPSGRPVELKPNTPTGISSGAKQMVKYERAAGKKGRVTYYNPDI